MKKTVKNIFVFITAALTIVSLTSCSLKGAIQGGTWDGSTFTNEWSNIKMELPSEFTAATAEEIQAGIADANEVMVNDGMDKASIDASQLKTLYDFSVSADDGLSSLMLMYENLSFSSATSGYTAEDYYKATKDGLLALTDFGYTEVSKTTGKIAGEEYIKATFSVFDGLMFQDYYIRKLDGAIVGFISTYTEETEAKVNNLVNSITAAK